MEDVQNYAWFTVGLLLLWPIGRLLYLETRQPRQPLKMSDFHLHLRHKARLH